MKIKQKKKHQATSIYVQKTASRAKISPMSYQDYADNSEKNISTTARLLGQSGGKYFEYFVFNIVDYICVGCALQRLGALHRALAQTIGNAQGLDINSPLSAEAHTQDLRFCRHQQHGDPNSARGLDNSFASDRGCDSTTTTRLRHRLLRPRRPRRTR
jgi:hypothetical protein